MKKLCLTICILSFSIVHSSDDSRPLLEERGASTKSMPVHSYTNTETDTETDTEAPPQTNPRSNLPKKWSLTKKATLFAMSATALAMAGTSIWIQLPDNRSVVSAPMSPQFESCSLKEPFIITGTCNPIADDPICFINHCQSQSSVDTHTVINLCQNLLGTFFGIVATGLYALHD